MGDLLVVVVVLVLVLVLVVTGVKQSQLLVKRLSLEFDKMSTSTRQMLSAPICV